MKARSIARGESLTRLLQGTVLGVVATMVIGFYWGGWLGDDAGVGRTQDVGRGQGLCGDAR